jgi:hypothetical protein
MKRLGRTIVIGVTATALGATGTMLAYAGGWTLNDGRMQLTMRVAKMPRGVTPSVAKQSKAAVVSWSSQELVPGVLMDHYVVTAHSVDEPPLPNVAHTVAAGRGNTESVTFPAEEVAGGKWYWTINPKFAQWMGADSGKSQRLTFPSSPAPAARLALASAAQAPEPVPAPGPATATTTDRTTTGPAVAPAGTPSRVLDDKPDPAPPNNTSTEKGEPEPTPPPKAETPAPVESSAAPRPPDASGNADLTE